MLKYYEWAEANHHIQNPLSDANLMLLPELADIKSGMRQLDLACGRGEMLSRWAAEHGIRGVGVDISGVFLAAARARAAELGVADALSFVQADAAEYVPEAHAFDVVSCIGATWIGGGTVGTLELMNPALKRRPDARLLVGEVYWRDEPIDAALEAFGVPRDEWAVGLDGLLARFEEARTTLLDMVIATPQDWDRYAGLGWRTGEAWLSANPNHPEAANFRAFIEKNRRDYVTYERHLLGWGVFVLKLQD